MNESHVFAPMAWGLGKVRATALAIDHKVLRGAVALASNLRLATFQQLHIASEHDRYRLVDAAVTLWESRLGLLGNFADCVAPDLTSWCLRQGFAVQHVIPTDFCYNSHRFDSSREGLLLGRVTLCLAAWVIRPSCFTYLLRYFSR